MSLQDCGDDAHQQLDPVPRNEAADEADNYLSVESEARAHAGRRSARGIEPLRVDGVRCDDDLTRRHAALDEQVAEVLRHYEQRLRAAEDTPFDAFGETAQQERVSV